VCLSSPSAFLPRVQHSGKIVFPECPIFGTRGSTWHSGNFASPVVIEMLNEFAQQPAIFFPQEPNSKGTLRRLICGQQLVHACTYVPQTPTNQCICMRNVYIAKHLRRWVISERHFSLLGLLGPFYRFLFTTSFSWQEKRAHFLIMFFPTSYSTNNDAAIAFLPSHTQKELGVILPRCS
jgi:hypothetical protein